MWETQVRSLGWEDPLEKEMATHSSTLAWRIPQTVQSRGSHTVEYDWATNTFTFFFHVLLIGGEWNIGNIGSSKWLIRKVNGLWEEQKGDMTVCDKVCLGVVLISSLLSCDESVFPGGWKSLGEGTYDNWFPLGGCIFRQIRGVQRVCNS